MAIVTAEEFARIPDDDARYELVAGAIVRMSPVGAMHGMVATRLARALDQYVADNRLGVVLSETGFKLAARPDTVRAPDLAFIRRDRLPHDRLPSAFWNGPPDLAVEVRSPEDRHTALYAKAAEYLSYGVRLVWLIYPAERIATVFAPGLVPVVLQSDGSLTGADVIPGFSCRVAELFTLP
jgi:Uma2 family endonuclease